MMRWEKIGSFGLTEPLVGSATSGGIRRPVARRRRVVLNGQKKWIGNSTFSEINVIWARDEASGQVKGFVVEKDNPGFSVEKIKTKMALRVVQNASLRSRLPRKRRGSPAERQHVQGLRQSPAHDENGRRMVCAGLRDGRLQHALRYAVERKQFGKPIGGFQLVQDLLVRMLGNVTACQAMMLRLAQLQDQGAMEDEHASLAKALQRSSAEKPSAMRVSSSGATAFCSRTISAVLSPTPRPSIPMKARAR